MPGTTLAEDKDAARELRVKRVLPALGRGQQVELDFSAVGLATQSFVHALISEAIWRYGDQAFELLRFSGCNEDVRQVVLAVFQYARTASQAGQTSPVDDTHDDAIPS